MDTSGEIWIDGFNLFHAWIPTRADFQQTRGTVGDGERMGRVIERALRLLATALDRRARRVVVFLDGGLSRAAETRHGLRVRWAGPGRKADDLMTQSLRGRAGSRVLAVSDDRRLIADLRALGARTGSATEFTRAVLARPRPPARAGRLRDQELAAKNRRLSAAEVRAWLEVFATDEGDKAQQPGRRAPARKRSGGQR